LLLLELHAFGIFTTGILDNPTDFFGGFLTWINSLTIWEILAIMSLMLVDVGRNIGKAIVLGILNIKRHFRPLNFGQANITYPKISLLIPAHNESVSIIKTIQSALENPYLNKEIIVIDDHSSDDTYKLAMPFVEAGQIKLLRRAGIKGSRAAAVNYGCLYATGDVVMVTDGDTLIERNTLTEVARYLSIPKVVAVAGNVRVLGGDGGVNNLLTKCQRYEYLISFELGRRVRTILNVLVIIPGAFSAFKRDIGKKAGFYDMDNITEDFDISVKLFKTGGDIEFVPTAIAWTYCPNNLRSWIRQRIRWSHGQLVTLLKHKDVFTTRNVTYNFLFILGVYDMIFVDILLLFARTVALGWLLLTFTQSIIYVFTLIFLVYLFSELVAITTAGLFSTDKSDLKLVYLVPVMLFVYRPLYAYVRLYAFARAFVGKGQKW
jgi:cellulose synthase/poly-beta-1,6-N-acetylglucosamine synthase-like glycosyltransferase